MAKKTTQKELKAPDQFVSFWAKAGTWIGERRKTMLLGLAGLAAAVAIIWAVQAFRGTQAEKASADFARLTRIASAPLLPETGEPPSREEGIPQFKTEKERLEAALKETDAFLSAHSGKLEEEASLLKARFLMSLGRPAEALAVYEQAAGSIDERLRFLAVEGKGFAQEATGQIDKAIATFDGLAAAAKTSGNFLRDRALYNKARLLEQKGAPKDAEKVYREILSEVPASSLKDEINDRLAVLEGK